MNVQKGDVVWYLWPPRGPRREPEWAEVSSTSHLNPNIVFGRNDKGKARCIQVADITRIKRKNTSDD